MLFNSIDFIFYFLPLSLIVFYLSPSNYRSHVLLATSLFFYSWWNPVYTPLLLVSILANFSLGRAIARSLRMGRKRYAALAAIGGIMFNLSGLVFFKVPLLFSRQSRSGWQFSFRIGFCLAVGHIIFHI